jgi:hypothetical protein
MNLEPTWRVNNEKFSLKLQFRRKNINLDNKTHFSYPEGYP